MRDPGGELVKESKRPAVGGPFAVSGSGPRSGGRRLLVVGIGSSLGFGVRGRLLVRRLLVGGFGRDRLRLGFSDGLRLGFRDRLRLGLGGDSRGLGLGRRGLGLGRRGLGLGDGLGLRLRDRLGLTQRTAVIVVNVRPDSPAGAGGLIIGDVVLSIGDAVIAEPEDVVAALRPERVGQTVTVRIVRGGEPRELRVAVGERPPRA